MTTIKIIALIIIVIVALAAVALFFYPPKRVARLDCVDSDGGIDTKTAGTTENSGLINATMKDICIDDAVLEFYCNPEEFCDIGMFTHLEGYDCVVNMIHLSEIECEFGCSGGRCLDEGETPSLPDLKVSNWSMSVTDSEATLIATVINSGNSASEETEGYFMSGSPFTIPALAPGEDVSFSIVKTMEGPGMFGTENVAETILIDQTQNKVNEINENNNVESVLFRYDYNTGEITKSE